MRCTHVATGYYLMGISLLAFPIFFPADKFIGFGGEQADYDYRWSYYPMICLANVTYIAAAYIHKIGGFIERA